VSVDLQEKIASLLRLARDPRTPKHEARAAKLAAERRLRDLEGDEETILRSPERDRSIGRSADPSIVRIGDPLFVMNESQNHYRVAKLTPPARVSDQIVHIPKAFVRDVQWMGMQEIEAIGWRGSGRIMRSITLDRAYFQSAVINGWNAWS
jgi:hypothetical protein